MRKLSSWNDKRRAETAVTSDLVVDFFLFRLLLICFIQIDTEREEMPWENVGQRRGAPPKSVGRCRWARKKEMPYRFVQNESKGGRAATQSSISHVLFFIYSAFALGTQCYWLMYITSPFYFFLFIFLLLVALFFKKSKSKCCLVFQCLRMDRVAWLTVSTIDTRFYNSAIVSYLMGIVGWASQSRVSIFRLDGQSILIHCVMRMSLYRISKCIARRNSCGPWRMRKGLLIRIQSSRPTSSSPDDQGGSFTKNTKILYFFLTIFF